MFTPTIFGQKQKKNSKSIFLVEQHCKKCILVDASKAGEGQLEISINDGDVPNAVQV